MSSAPEGFPFGSSSETVFEPAMRGYDKKQVNRFVQQVEAEITGLVAEREEMYAQVNLLNQHVAQLQHEVAMARRSAAPTDAAAYRHLGAKVEHIPGLAEEQAIATPEPAQRSLPDREAGF